MTAIPVSYITDQTKTTTSTTSSSSTSTGTLDSSDFMELLIAQLKNQDPSSPMDTTAMMTQTTQLSMMEALTSISDTSKSAFELQQRSTAAGYVGGTVTWLDTDGVSHSGVATGVTYSSTEPTLTVGSSTVTLSSITSVHAA